MDVGEVIKNEHTLLRAELRELKKCQLQYFLASVAGTGAIVGLIQEPTVGKELFFLAPLVIILPCWCTFFDKATTITRLAGYIAFLENQLSSPTPKYIGYETSLREFRRKEDQYIKSTMAAQTEEEKNSASNKRSRLQYLRKTLNRYGFVPNRDHRELMLLRTRHRFWMLNWYTFCTLSLLCCFLPFRFKVNPYPFSTQYTVWYLAGIATLLSMVYTFFIVLRLTCGSYSYDAFSKFWKEQVFKDFWYEDVWKR
ncbi:MAG: hypothetical protein ACREEM_38615 [Blastocatellia bacterium]